MADCSLCKRLLILIRHRAVLSAAHKCIPGRDVGTRRAGAGVRTTWGCIAVPIRSLLQQDVFAWPNKPKSIVLLQTSFICFINPKPVNEVGPRPDCMVDVQII